MNRPWSPKLGDVTESVKTWNPARDANQPFYYVDLSAVDQSEKAITDAALVEPHDAPSRARQIVRTDDILVSTVRPNLNAVARVTDRFDGTTASTGFCVLRPTVGKVDPNYLFHWVRTPQFIDDMVRNATGASYPAVSDRIIKASVFPLPPLDEQRRIAAILDKADALRQKRKRAIALLDSLTQSIFLEMFGDPRQNPLGIREVELAKVADFFAGNSLPVAEDYRAQEDGYLLLKVSDMNLPGNEEFISYSASWSAVPGSKASTCPTNTIVFPKRGGAISTNKKRRLSRPAVLDPNVMGVYPKRGSLHDDYLFSWFQKLDLVPISSGSSVPQLNKQDLAPLKIAVPDMERQVEFAARLQITRPIKLAAATALAKTESLFVSLQHRAFSGEFK